VEKQFYDLGPLVHGANALPLGPPLHIVWIPAPYHYRLHVLANYDRETDNVAHSSRPVRGVTADRKEKPYNDNGTYHGVAGPGSVPAVLPGGDGGIHGVAAPSGVPGPVRRSVPDIHQVLPGDVVGSLNHFIKYYNITNPILSTHYYLIVTNIICILSLIQYFPNLITVNIFCSICVITLLSTVT